MCDCCAQHKEPKITKPADLKKKDPKAETKKTEAKEK